jgi:hypothetical protein
VLSVWAALTSVPAIAILDVDVDVFLKFNVLYRG